LPFSVDSAYRSRFGSKSRSERRVDGANARFPCALEPVEDATGTIPSCDADRLPAELRKPFISPDVLGELNGIGSVLVALVLHRDLKVLPAQIEVVPPPVKRIPHRNLGLGSRVSRAND